MAKIKQKNEKGEEEEIEVFTPEEVAAEKAKLEETHKAEMEEKDKFVQALASEKADLEKKIKDAELSGLKEDHPNFKILKEALQKKDEEIKKISTDLENDRKSRKQEALENEIKVASKGNVELEKKIKLHLKETLSALPEETPEQRKVKLEAAIKLSSDGSSNGPGMFDNGAGAGGMGNGSYGAGGSTETVEFTAREKALGAKMGITQEDYKKYGPKLTNKIKQ